MTRRLGAGAGLALLMSAGCFLWRREEPPSAIRTPDVIPTVSSAPRSESRTEMSVAEPAEPIVDLELADAPVKLILERLAEIGGLRLVIPPNLNKTLTVQYVRVPVSVALNDVLKRSRLQLGTGPAPNLPFDTVTVFYQLPASIDSMSVDAIMRRFGVSRGMAELIVKSRRP